MAKPKGKGATKAEIELAEGVLTDIPLDEITDPELIAVEKVMKFHGDTSAKVTVYKQGAGGYRDLQFLYDCPPTEWLADGPGRIQREYGGGKYRLHMQDDAGHLVINKGIDIAPLPKSRLEPQAATPAQAPAQGAEVLAALGGIGEAMKGMAEAIISIRSQPPANPLESMKQVADIMRTLMPAAPVVAAAGNSIDTTLSVIRTVLDMTKDMRGKPGDGESDPGNAALLRGIDVLGNIFEQGIKQKNGVAQPSEVAALPAPASQPEGEVMNGVDPLALAQLRLGLQMAVRDAKAGRQPREFAETVYDSLPDDALVSFLLDSDWYGTVCRIEPSCGPHQAWLSLVHGALVEFALEDELIMRDAAGQLTLFAESGKVPANGDSHAGTGDSADVGGGGTTAKPAG